MSVEQISGTVLVYPEPSFFLYRIVLVREQFVILSRTGGLQRQPNLFLSFLAYH